MRVLGTTALDCRSTCASDGLERQCSSFGPCPEEPVPKGNNPEVEYEGGEETMSEDLFPGEPGLGSGLADNQDEPYEPESPIAEPERSAQRKPEQVRFQVDENERGAGQAKEVPVPVPPSAEEKAQHELHHANFEPWCEVCVMWQGRDKHHHRRKEDPKEIKRAHSVCRLHVLHQGGWIPRKNIKFGWFWGQTILGRKPSCRSYRYLLIVIVCCRSCNLRASRLRFAGRFG